MVKRRQTIESDESEEEERSVTPPNKRAKNSRRGKHAAPDVEIKEDVDMVEEDAEGEEEAEWAHQDVRAAINGTSGGRGTIAEAGVIQQITLKDFMCHRHLVFDFGPKINFITGRNGSGKSAVLSAIQIALGARTYLTGRGSSLKNFVKSGRESAEVIIKLKNGGPEAFRPDVFGKSITISRKISAKDGNGTWKILNEQGKTVSTTKREVQDMSDHMNLQVIDSPLNVLTQDASRQFLIQATPSDKYAFFLKGTQLQQLSEEYELVMENIKKTDKALQQKKEIIPQLREAAREAQEKLAEAHKAQDQSRRVKELKKELAWSHVDFKRKDIGNQGRQADQDRVKTLKDIDDNRAWMDNILASEKNKLNVYGKDTEAIIAAIEQTQWTGSARPIGPLGQYVTLTNSTYQPLFQAVIGSAMFQYAVTNEADRKKLADILKRNGQQNPRIIMGEPDLFDYSQGRPKDSTIVTPLDVLEISDQWVVRILINAYGVERIGLTKTRAEAERRAGEDPGRMFWAAELHRVQKYTDGGWSSQTITPVSGRDPRRSLFHSGGSAGSMEKARQRDGDLQHKLQTIDNILSDLRSRQATTGHALDECKKSWKALSENIRSLKHRKEELEELSKEEAPVMVAALEATRQQQLDEIENIKAQFAEVERKRQKTSEELKPLAERTNALREQINVAEQERNTINQQLQELSDKTAKAINDERHYQEKLDQAQADILRQQEKLNITQQEVDLWTEKASQYCEEVPNPRKTDIIQKEIEASNSLIVSLVVYRGVLLSKQATDLSTRNYTGKIVFDHTTCTLDVRVQTEDQTLMTKQARQKDTKALSGGEKSYATICLLLALWESVGSPIRCLDEYDVFMDGINRLVATKLMIDSAKSSEAKQYIFISPLDVCNYIENPREVKINRMPDPDRGGGQTSIDT
ncbi:Structural maintenance of chromosomes protein 6 [Tulasnella sp. 403]|nr:Structural maintenance of chromosomes protein 6 [Tulasnella sp. 403]